MATKPNFVSIPLSFYYNGIWQSANWSARVVDDDTGEIILSAELPSGDDNGPFAALRLTIADVATLRTLAGFTQSIPVQQSDPSHSSNPSELGDVNRRLAALEAAAAPSIANRAWMDEIEKRLDDLVLRAVSETTHLALMKRVNELGQLSEAIIKDCVDIEDRLNVIEDRIKNAVTLRLCQQLEALTAGDA